MAGRRGSTLVCWTGSQAKREGSCPPLGFSGVFLLRAPPSFAFYPGSLLGGTAQLSVHSAGFRHLESLKGAALPAGQM